MRRRAKGEKDILKCRQGKLRRVKKNEDMKMECQRTKNKGKTKGCGKEEAKDERAEETGEIK